MKATLTRLTALMLALVISVAALASCKEKEPEKKAPYYGVEMDVEGYGTIEMTLVRAAAPKTVDNFVKLANKNFYDGLTFIRAEEGFVIQGGEGSKRATRKLTPIAGEFYSNGYTKNSISHKAGVISMARSSDPNSATSQFFITTGDARSSLDGKYAGFGYVHAESMKIVYAIESGMVPYADPSMGFVSDKKYQPVITDMRVTPIFTADALAVENNPDITTVEMAIKDYGTIKIKLLRSAAPETVANFIELAESGFYDGLTFIRAQKGFVIQGGKPSDESGLETIPGEFLSNGFSSNTITHTPGVISMARTSDPDSATSQFFITIGDATYLDGNYAAFGYVDEASMQIVYKVAEDMIPHGDSNMGFVDDEDKQVVISSIRVAAQ